MQVLTAQEYRDRGEGTNISSTFRSYLNKAELTALREALRKAYPDKSRAYIRRWYTMFAGRPVEAMEFVNEMEVD